MLKQRMQFAFLDGNFDRSKFDCGQTDLNRWFRETAWQHMQKGLSATYLASNEGDVVGFYTLTVDSIMSEQLPKYLAKRLPRKAPIYVLGRLAVMKEYQRKGYGELILTDAIKRSRLLAQSSGGIALVVDSKEDAVSFYLCNDFVRNPYDELRLIYLF